MLTTLCCVHAIENHGFRDCLKIQSSLNGLAEWCEAYALELSVCKCESNMFSRLRHPIEFLYMLDGIILGRVDSINDLGVIIHSKVSLTGHIDYGYGWKGFGNAGVCKKVVV
jgi:hypothetical protein